jgi:tyrosyl-tRNA synthetase
MWRWYTLAELQVRGRHRRLKAEVDGRRNPKDAKVALAKEITARFHSAAAADAAEQDFINRSKGGVPDEIPEVTLWRKRARWASARCSRPPDLRPPPPKPTA